MSKPKADLAEFDLEARFHVTVTAEGAVHVSAQPYRFPPIVARRHSAKELREDPTLNGEEWFEGGVAMLGGFTEASNGAVLKQLADETAEEIVSMIHQIRSHVSKP